MRKYWPTQPSIELNYSVVDLFINTKKKFKQNLSTNTTYSLYIDILDNNTKYKLFSIILHELEKLILDIIELNLDIDHLKQIKYKILYNFIVKNLIQFLYYFNINHNIYIYKKQKSYNSILLNNSLLIEDLLIYLLFGSSYIDDTIFIFHYNFTPIEHVIILFENFIIQVSNSIIYHLLNDIKYLPNIIYFLKKYQLCNTHYLSIRSIALFFNKLMIQKLLYIYIHQPKEMYSSRYQIWIISSQGLTKKYIYLFKLANLYKISNNKYIILFIIEMFDIIIPQTERLLLIIGKSLLYITINILGNSIIFIIRTLIKYLNH